jgi:hypothetical protein
MEQRHIIFVPGKNPKPAPDQHHALLWRTLVEGVRRAEPQVADNLSQHIENFKLIAWNYLYYHRRKDINRDLPWIDALMNQHGPSEQDIQNASSTPRKLHRLLYNIIDHLPFLLKLLPGDLQSTAGELQRYFQNKKNIACDVREVLKQELRPILKNNDNILLIGHSMGSIIAYDTLWELSHLEELPGKIDFLTIGSPLGMNYVLHRLLGGKYTGKNKYPTNIRNWINISSEGDVTALDRIFSDDFSEMRKLEIVESIEDHCEGIYNFFHNDKGLNCHRSYGYLVNPAVGKVIADWWQRFM